MAKIDPDMLTAQDMKSPQIVQRYIAKYRELKGPRAKRNTAQAHKWFMGRISKDTNLKTERVYKELKENKTRKAMDKGLIGRLFLFNYDPKTKDTLPVYDTWPLVFFFNAHVGSGNGNGEKGVLYLHGINMHYLSPKLRLILFTELIKLKNDSALREKTRLKLSWQIIKKLAGARLAEHAVKTYRADHIRSELAEVYPQDWIIVISMQISRFVKGGKAMAWRLK
ncbi:DNA end protector [Vibrio phage K469]